MIDEKTRPKRRMTVEVGLWLLVLALALSLRLFQLDLAPLSVPEAHEATLAWRAAFGQGRPQTDDYSPLLFALNTATFTLRGRATDSLARFWPAIAGALLTLTPFLLRDRVGRWGALAAGFYLSISPACLVASRQVDGAVFAALGGMLCLGGLSRLLKRITNIRTADRRWLYLAALGFALALTGGSLAYGIFLALGVAGALCARLGVGVEKTWGRTGGKRPHEYLARLRPHGVRFVGVASVLLLAFSTMLGLNSGGVGAVGGLLVDWLAGFRAVIRGLPPLLLLLVYEPLALLFGLGGIGVTLWRRHRFGLLVSLWVAVGAFLLMLAPGSAPLSVLGVVLPLSLLVGVACEQLAHTDVCYPRYSPRPAPPHRDPYRWLSDGAHFSVVLLLWLHCGLMLARYATFGAVSDLVLATLTVALQILLTAMFAVTMDREIAIARSACLLALGTGIVALGVTFAAGWGVAHVRPWDAREPLLRAPTDLGVRSLVETLQEHSWRETGLPTTLRLAVQADPDSPLTWYLRALDSGFSALHLIGDSTSESVDATGPFSVVVTTGGNLDALASGAIQDSQTARQDFVLRRRWDLKSIGCVWTWPPDCRALVRWWLFRETDAPPLEEWFGGSATLWVSEWEE